MKRLDLRSTLEGSLLEGFFPRGWDLARLDEIASRPPERIGEREAWWHEEFEPEPCQDVVDMEVHMGLEIAWEVLEARRRGQRLALVLPVGPMGMYRWAVMVLRRAGVSCDHLHGFNMDEWSDRDGATLDPGVPGAFQGAMEEAFYGPLGHLAPPPRQRWFATRDLLPRYAAEIGKVLEGGGRLVVVYGIGRVLHIAFWEPHFAAEYSSTEAWRAATHRLGARLHPLTIEQNAITSFKSRTTLVPAFANTIGPGIFLQAHRAIGGADGVLGRGMQWQGFSLWAALHHPPDAWLPATHMPALPGRLFFVRELAGPLAAACN